MKQYIFPILLLLIYVSSAYADESLRRAESSQKRLAEFELEYKSATDPSKQFDVESQIVSLYASAALSSESIKLAKVHADSLLSRANSYKKTWNYGNAVHHANLVLGRISLFQGNIEAAKKYLSLAASVTGSPQLKSFGPNMTLAKELLEKKEKLAVLKYIEDCQSFWDPEFSKRAADAWRRDIEEDKIPNFGGNLKY